MSPADHSTAEGGRLLLNIHLEAPTAEKEGRGKKKSDGRRMGAGDPDDPVCDDHLLHDPLPVQRDKVPHIHGRVLPPEEARHLHSQAP